MEKREIEVNNNKERGLRWRMRSRLLNRGKRYGVAEQEWRGVRKPEVSHLMVARLVSECRV
jgi:hypothetical protein